MITIKTPPCYDVSHWKEILNFHAVDPRPLLFITKATEHTLLVDSKFVRFFDGMEQIGVRRGAFHFFRRAFDPVKQAQHFCKTIYPHITNDDILILDVEEGGEKADQLWAWFEYVRGSFPLNLLMIYSRANILNAIVMTENERAYFKKIPVWTAGYPEFPDVWDQPLSGYIPDRSKWGPVWLWQYSAHGAVTGIDGDVDLNWMSPELIEYLGGEIVPPEEPTEGEPMATWYRVNTATLNIRTGGGTTYTDIGDLHFNDRVEVEGAPVNGWLHVKRIIPAGTNTPSPLDGWCSAQWCVVIPAPTLPPTPSEVRPTRFVGTVELSDGSKWQYTATEFTKVG